MIFRSFFFLLPLTIPTLALGSYSVQSDSEIASGYASQHFEAHGPGMTPEGLHFSGWNISAGGSRSKEENSATGEITYTNSRDFSAGLDFGYTQTFLLSLSLDSTRTSENEYSQTTSGAAVSYHSEPAEGWAWNAGAGHYQGDIKQHLSFQILNTRIERDVSLNQRETQVLLGVSPMPSLSLQLRASAFSYSKSKQDLQTAFQNRFLNTYTTDLISSISGLPESQFKLNAIYQLQDTWDLSLSSTQTKRIVDDSTSRRGEIIASHDIKDWRLGAGVARSQNDNLTDWSAIFELSYIWD